MTPPPARFLHLVLIGCCAASALASAACQSGRAHEGAAAPLVRGGLLLRLGSVTSQNSADFEIPADVLNEAASVTLVASPLGGRESFSTPLTGIRPGDELELTVENLLPHSHLVVR